MTNFERNMESSLQEGCCRGPKHIEQESIIQTKDKRQSEKNKRQTICVRVQILYELRQLPKTLDARG